MYWITFRLDCNTVPNMRIYGRGYTDPPPVSFDTERRKLVQCPPKLFVLLNQFHHALQ